MSATAVMETSEPTLVLGPHGNIHARDVDDKIGCVYSHLHDAVEQYVRGAVCACRALFGVGGWVVGGWVGVQSSSGPCVLLWGCIDNYDGCVHNQHTTTQLMRGLWRVGGRRCVALRGVAWRCVALLWGQWGAAGAVGVAALCGVSVWRAAVQMPQLIGAWREHAS